MAAKQMEHTVQDMVVESAEFGGMEADDDDDNTRLEDLIIEAAQGLYQHVCLTTEKILKLAQ
jgi:hypothetical protein